MKLSFLSRWVIGNPLATDRLKHERLSKTQGLAVFSSDALSSSAYATEEIVRVLIFAGAAGLAMTLPIATAIVLLLVIVAVSYYQTIHAYPHGGGAYIVAYENLGAMPGLIAASAILVDYILTVAVSLSAGVAAVTSAIPSLHEHRLLLAIFFIIFMTVMNLRGIRESGSFFAIPAYAFIGIFGGMILWGVISMLMGKLPAVAPVIPPHADHQIHALGIILVLRAFASGAAALTGIEAVSDGIPAFKPPESQNAGRVLITMIVILGTFFFGISFLAYHLGVTPSETETVVSQIARQIFGRNYFYYAVQGATTLILILAANTAYSDFPRLSSFLARDRYLPRQLGNLGDRLVFTNGILLLGIVVSILLIIFDADTHSLIPLYMVGVFISFTLSQTGMVVRSFKLRPPGWRIKLGINAFGAVCTLVVGVVVAMVKFEEGAWITLLVIGIFVSIMLSIRKHYDFLTVQLSLEHAKVPRPFTNHKVIIPVSSVHRGTLEAVRYAKALGGDLRAAYVEIDPERTEGFRKEWNKWFPDVELDVVPSPYRSVVGPLLLYMDQVQHHAGIDTALTVLIPQFIPRKMWHHVLHNQTAFTLKLALLYRRRGLRRYKVLSDVPFYLRK